MSDFSDSDGDEGEQCAAFTQAADRIQHIYTTLGQGDLLELYGMYKQAIVGDCDTSKPGFFNMQARAKWSAWNDLKGMPKCDAKQLYVRKVQQLDPSWSIDDNATANEQRSKKSSSHLTTGWVVHSIEQRPDDDDAQQKPEHEKTAFDYVKELNVTRLEQLQLSQEQLHELDEQGMGLIHWATDRNSVDVLRYLLAAGTNVNHRDGDQQTALHYAASCGHVECVRVLLSFNADLHAKDADGQTCIQVAECGEVIALFST